MGIRRRLNLTGARAHGRLADCQLAAPDFELGPDEILWSAGRQRDEFSNVVRCNRW
jgi:hypothetical protein